MKKTLYTLFNLCLSTCAIIYPLGHVSAISSAETYNERHVQSQLNGAILTTPGLAADVAVLSALPASAQRDALNDLSGQQYTNLIQANQVASQQFMRRMYEPVRYDSLGLHCGQNCDQWQIWSAIGGGQAFQSNSHGAKGYRLYDYNIAFGVQKPLNFQFLNSWLTVGAAGSYERDHIHFKQGGRGRGNNWQGALYYMWNNERFYSFSATILGTDCVKVRRPIDFGTIHERARGKARIGQWTSYSEIGLNLCCECLYLQPFVGVEYAFYRRHALSERRAGLFNLHVRGKNVSATIGRVGVHLTTTLPWWGLYVNADVAWRTRFNFLQERIQANFKHFGSRFRVKGVHQKPNGVEGALNIAKTFCDCWQTYVEVAGEKWDRYSAWNVSGGVTLVW